MANEHLRARLALVLRLGLVAVAFAAFGWYLSRHGELLTMIADAPRWVVGALLLLYVCWFLTLTATVHATFIICGRNLGAREQLLLSAYSTLVNFFAPGQGGVALRGIHMKKRHGLQFKTYLLATMVYYGCFATIGGLFLLLPNLSWGLSLLLLLATVAAGLGLLHVGRTWPDRWLPGLRLTAGRLVALFAWTLANGAIQVAIYLLELRAVAPATRLGQAITYTGAANFAQFAALTPGAIGIRESFLLFTERLHGIPTRIVLAASLMDRAAFLLLLACLFCFSLALHARRTLGVASGVDGQESGR